MISTDLALGHVAMRADSGIGTFGILPAGSACGQLRLLLLLLFATRLGLRLLLLPRPWGAPVRASCAACW